MKGKTVKDTEGMQTYYVSETAKVGKGCDIRHGAILENDVVVGDSCYIGEYAHLTAGTIVESHVYIGAKALLLNTERITYMRGIEEKLSPVRIKRGARIASATTILPGVTVGENALVGIGAVVTKDVPTKQIHFGWPASKRGSVPENECLSKNLAKGQNIS